MATAYFPSVIEIPAHELGIHSLPEAGLVSRPLLRICGVTIFYHQNNLQNSNANTIEGCSCVALFLLHTRSIAFNKWLTFGQWLLGLFSTIKPQRSLQSIIRRTLWYDEGWCLQTPVAMSVALPSELIRLRQTQSWKKSESETNNLMLSLDLAIWTWIIMES